MSHLMLNKERDHHAKEEEELEDQEDQDKNDYLIDLCEYSFYYYYL